jgi:hypothetical protein
MRPEDIHPEGCGGGSARSVGALIRAAADQELTPEQVAEFERLCAERNCTQDRVRFEQTLRESCGRVMTASPCCTEALRAKIMAMAVGLRGDDGSAGAAAGSPAGPAAESVAERVERLSPQTRTVAFWRRSPGMAAAAVLLFSVAGVLVWQASRLPTAPPPAGMTHRQVAYRDRVAGFVSDEHGRCCRSDVAAQAKLIHRDPASARAYYAQAFGTGSVTVEAGAVEAGEVSFWGGGDCHVPGSTRSAHVRFDAVSPEGEPIRLSLFVMPDNERLPLEPETTYRLNAAACDEAGVALYAWSADGLTYLLVSEATGEFCGMVRQALQAPARLASY